MEETSNHSQVGGPTVSQDAAQIDINAPALTRATKQNKAFLIAEYVFWIMLAFILLRFAFKLIGANSQNAFVTLIYNFTNPIVTPFQGIVGDVTSGTMIIEFGSLISILVLWLVYKAALRLITIVR